jgi:hypothetical protein
MSQTLQAIAVPSLALLAVGYVILTRVNDAGRGIDRRAS